jgi:hypothetical protein
MLVKGSELKLGLMAMYRPCFIIHSVGSAVSYPLPAVSQLQTPRTGYDPLSPEEQERARTLAVQRGAFSLSAYAGQTIRGQFRATGNESLITNFLIDDVSVR